MPETFEFTARVSQDAIGKVTRLFNASLDDILNELLQNARRSGASKIEVDQFDHDELGPVIQISDDGPGLDNPTVLFTLGKSDWDKETSAREDAAGMGFFSLSGRRVRIIHQVLGTDKSSILEVEPDAFTGKLPIVGFAGPDHIRGVRILISKFANENVVPAANKAAKFFPLPVFVEGVEAKRETFLAEAVAIETWRGIRIGVYRKPRHDRLHHDNANFHGITLNMPLPSLSQNYHNGFYARIDIESCADLKLVLPARKEVVRDAFYQALCDKIETLYFSLIKQQVAHSLSFKDHVRAQEMGIELPEAVQKLRPFSPSHADRDSNSLNDLETVKPDAFIFYGTDEAVDEQNLAWAMAEQEEQVRLYEPLSAFEGYHWYDAIHCVELTGYSRQIGPVRQDSEIGDVPDIVERPDRLFITGVVHADGSLTPWEIETDLLLFADESMHIDETVLCLTKPASITVPDLIDFLTRCLFCPSDDYDAGSYDSQLQWFTDEAEDAAIAYLQTIEDVQLNQVLRTFRRELYWILKPQADITFHVRGREVDVFGLETVFKPQSA